jgi:hypothetical protein
MNIGDTIILIVRIFAIPTIFIGVLAVMDDFLPVSMIDEAVIQSKEISHSRGTTYSIQAQGKYSYSECVSEKMYSIAQAGMTLRLHLTKIFKVWRNVEITNKGQVLFRGRGQDFYWMPAMGFVMTLTGLCYLKTEKWFNLKSLIFFAVFEFIGVALLAKLVLVWLGFVAKM